MAAITLAGAVLRLYALDRLPPGLYRDEAFNGLDALSVLGGNLPVYFEANNGREPLFIYLVAASIAFLGRSPFAIRIVPALFGTLTIPATYLLGRELSGRRVAIWSAALAAGTFWTLNLSRVGFRAVVLPLISALALWQLTRGLRSGEQRELVLAGVLLGLSLYTYLAAPFGILAVALFLIYTRILSPQTVTARRLVALVAPLVLVATPLALFQLVSAAGPLRGLQVAIWNPEIHGGDLLGTFWGNLVGSLGMFVWRGDFIPRHNLPWRPVFDPLMAVLFLVGLLVAIRRWRQPLAAGLPLLWTATMILPTLLAENAPHFLRAVGVLPVLFLLPAMGVEWVHLRLAGRTSSSISHAALAIVLVVSAGWTVRDYFSRHLPSEAVYFNFESGATEMAARINRHLGSGWSGVGISSEGRTSASGREVLLDERLWRDWASVRYLVPASTQLHLLDATERQPATAGETLLVAWPFQDLVPLIHLLPVGSPLLIAEGAQERGDLEPEARLLYVSVETRPDISSPDSLDAAFGDTVALTGHKIDRNPTGLVIRLFWETIRPIGEDYIVFLHAMLDGQRVAQADGPPLLGRYPMSRWREGEVILDEHLFPLGEGQVANELAVGLYVLETGERLPVAFPTGIVADSVFIALDR